MTEIQITGATGTPPYSIYVCDQTLSYCYLITGSTTIPPTFTFNPPPPLDGVDSLIVKLIDSSGCEYFEPFSCPLTPTPTPTITPTPSSTPTNLCYCITAVNTGMTTGSFYYVDCDGVLIEKVPVPADVTYYCCGSNPTLPDQVSITVGPLCISNSCPDPSPTPTPTPTPPIIIPPCSVIYNTFPASIYSYDLSSNTSTLLPVSSIVNISDVSHTSNKLWVSSPSNIREWDITLSPFTSTFNRVISLPITIGPGLGSIDDTTLIAVTNSVSPNQVVTLDVTTNTAVPTFNFPISTGRTLSGDIILTTTNKVILTTNSGSSRYISQYDYGTGILEFDILISPTILSPWGIFVDSGNIYIMDGSNSMVYNILTTSPFTLTLVGSVSGTPYGSSQIPSCVNTNFS